MELWGWLVGYVALFAVLHLLLYYFYVRRGDDERSSSPSFPDGNGTRTPYSPGPKAASGRTDDREADREREDGRQSERAAEGETVRCPHCGTPNEADPTYTYCRHCVSALRR